MASIAFTVTMTDATVISKTATVSDPDVARLLAAFGSRYAAPEGVTPDAPWLVGKWIEDTVVTAMNFVKSCESAQAASAAADGVQLIPFTLS